MKYLNLEKQAVLQARVDIVEAQQAVMAGFISVLMQTELHQLPSSQQAKLRGIYESLFEQTIARLLASDIGFSDATIRAIEHLKHNLLGNATGE